MVDPTDVLVPVWYHGHIAAYAKVDLVDSPLLRHHWTLHSAGYVVRFASASDRSLRLHREILGLTKGDPRQGDHVNRDRLDNRRSNLRIVTAAQNSQNVGSAPDTSSRFRGVTWHRAARKWQAKVKLNGVSHYLGIYEDEREAAEIARAFRVTHMPYAMD